MKASLLFILPAFFLFSCSGDENKTGERIDSMISLPIPPDTLNQHAAQNPGDTIKAADSSKGNTTPGDNSTGRRGEINEGIVYYTLPYCGGARPTEEVLENTKKLRLLTNTTLKLRNKTGEYVVTTDASGIFRSGIRSGTYDVYLSETTDKKIYDVSAANCENCLTQKMATVTLAHGTTASIVIGFRCGADAKKRP